MARIRWFLVTALLASVPGGAALAEGGSAPALAQPGTARAAATGYDDFAYSRIMQDAPAESPSDHPIAPPLPEETAHGEAVFAPVREYRAYGAGVFRPCNLGELWTIPQPRVTRALGLTLGGWMSAGLYGNGHGAPSNGAPLGFNEPTGFNLHQLWVYADREADTGGYGWDWGFRVDYVFGLDGPDTQCFGDESWDFGWDSSPDYGSAIPQLYGQLAYNDLTVKGGHFYTPIGYEVVQSTGNFFYSHAYTHTFGEPFTHTGFLGTWKYGPRVNFHGGWVAGWDTGWENRIDASTFLGGIDFVLTEKSTLAWFLNTGDFGTGQGNVYMNSIVWTWAVTNKLTYVFQHDLGTVTGLNVDNAQWYGINQYLLHQLSDCWGFGLRFEWFRDDDGTRVVVSDQGGNAGSYYALTAGFNWRPHRNLVFRPELRYDWYSGTVGSGARPFDNGARNEQLSGGFDMVFTF